MPTRGWVEQLRTARRDRDGCRPHGSCDWLARRTSADAAGHRPTCGRYGGPWQPTPASTAISCCWSSAAATSGHRARPAQPTPADPEAVSGPVPPAACRHRPDDAPGQGPAPHRQPVPSSPGQSCWWRSRWHARPPQSRHTPPSWLRSPRKCAGHARPDAPKGRYSGCGSRLCRPSANARNVGTARESAYSLSSSTHVGYLRLGPKPLLLGLRMVSVSLRYRYALAGCGKSLKRTLATQFRNSMAAQQDIMFLVDRALWMNIARASLFPQPVREVMMNFFGDKRFLYAIVAVIVVIIVVAAVFWPRNQTTESQALATTSSPTATPASPSTTVPKQ